MNGSDKDASEQKQIYSYTEHSHEGWYKETGTGLLKNYFFFHIDQNEISGNVTLMLPLSHAHSSLPHDLILWGKADLTWGRVVQRQDRLSAWMRQAALHTRISSLPIDT